MAIFEQGGHTIGYYEAGRAGAPLLLFAHCSLGHGGLWKGVVKALGDEWHSIALDLPGHGASDRGDEAISLQDQAAADVLTLAEAFGGGRAHLIGLSLGGAIMGRAAIRHPGLARSLTLIEPIWMQLLKDRDPEMARESHDVMQACYDACAVGQYEAGARAFMEGWGQPGQFDRFPEPAKRAVGRAMRWIHADFAMAHDTIPGQITREEIAAITAPTLLMQGETTRPSAKAIVRQVSSLLPAARVEEIGGGGHLSPVDDPAAVARVISAFLHPLETRGAA